MVHNPPLAVFRYTSYAEGTEDSSLSPVPSKGGYCLLVHGTQEIEPKFESIPVHLDSRYFYYNIIILFYFPNNKIREEGKMEKSD